MRIILLTLLPALALTACESWSEPVGEPPVDTVSLKYDPYNYDMAQLQENAEASCAAKGARYAIRAGSSVNTEEVRWAYMNFDCYD